MTLLPLSSQNDSWRKFQLLKSLAKADHPLNKFSTGSLETLHEAPKACGLNIRELMIQFHEKYYSASLMKLVLYGKHGLDEMEAWVRDKFAGIASKDVRREAVPCDPFGPQQRCKYLEIVPIK